MGMIFTDGTSTPEVKEPVAYIDSTGCLIIKHTRPITSKIDRAVFLGRAGSAEMLLDKFDPLSPSNKKVFYAGDSVTITFT
jgi:hypothetical protein